MSKSGLFAHFGSKEALQLSTLRAARRVFTDQAITPALAAACSWRPPRSSTTAPGRSGT
jgi:hypothetical protein